MLLGLTEEPLAWTRVLGRRIFPSQVRLQVSWAKLYRRDWTTPELGGNARHILVQAF